MREFVANAPIQTRQNSLDKHERLLAFLSAEALNRIHEYQTGEQSPRVDLWNTVGAKSEKDWSNANAIQPIGYQEYHRQQILSRYQILKEYYGIPQENRIILTDIDEQYSMAVTNNVRQRIYNGDFVVRNENFSHCSPCDYIIAPVDANIDKCPICNQKELDHITTKGLFSTIDKDYRQRIIHDAVVYPESTRSSLKRTVLTMPDQIQLSKQRRFGIRLTEFGVDDRFVLDPKLPLAMMGYVTNEMQLGQLKTFVQGTDSMGNLVPYVFLVDPNGRYSFVNIGLVPPFNSEILNDRNKPFYRNYLPLVIMSLPTGIDTQERLNLFKEFDRTSRQFQFALSSLEQIPAIDQLSDYAESSIPVKEIFGLLNQYKIKEGVAKMRQFIYEDLSRKYLNRCKEQRSRPSPDAFKQIKDLFSIIYKE
jgi:rubrerythrin